MTTCIATFSAGDYMRNLLIEHADRMMHAQTGTKSGRARTNKDRYPTVDPPGSQEIHFKTRALLLVIFELPARVAFTSGPLGSRSGWADTRWCAS